MALWLRRIRGRYGRWRLGKYWEVLGGFGRIHCRLYCKQYGLILRRGFKAAKNSSQNFPKPLKISQNLPRRHTQLRAAQAAELYAATHNFAPRKRQNSHAAMHNFAPRRRQNSTPPHTTPRRESGRTLRRIRGRYGQTGNFLSISPGVIPLRCFRNECR